MKGKKERHKEKQRKEGKKEWLEGCRERGRDIKNIVHKYK